MNIRNTTAKEKMLKQIRQALLHKRDNPFPDFEDSALYADEEESLDVTFAREWTALGGQFVYCDGEIDLIEQLIVLIEKLKASKIAVWEHSLKQLLDQYGFPYIAQDTNLSDMEVGITSCEALIARNGSVMLSSANASGRRLSVFPPVHIIFAKASQLVMDIKHGLTKIKERYGDDLPSAITMTTGSSCSTAMEYKVAKGGHGPKELYVFLIEDRF